jgi:hypothetical protein
VHTDTTGEMMAARAGSLAGLRPSARDKGEHVVGVSDEVRTSIRDDLGWHGSAEHTEKFVLSKKA